MSVPLLVKVTSSLYCHILVCVVGCCNVEVRQETESEARGDEATTRSSLGWDPASTAVHLHFQDGHHDCSINLSVISCCELICVYFETSPTISVTVEPKRHGSCLQLLLLPAPQRRHRAQLPVLRRELHYNYSSFTSAPHKRQPRHIGPNHHHNGNERAHSDQPAASAIGSSYAQ